eukprot:2471935-Amphidinium_carterae.2
MLLSLGEWVASWAVHRCNKRDVMQLQGQQYLSQLKRPFAQHAGLSTSRSYLRPWHNLRRVCFAAASIGCRSVPNKDDPTH